MEFLPGTENLIDEMLEIVALAHSFFVEQDNFNTFQYIKKESDARVSRILIEKILALSIKCRFLDDKTSIIKKHDREIATLGKYTIDEEKIEKASVREALNKIIHHQVIKLDIKSRNVTVVGSGKDTGDIKIPEGSYKLNTLILLVKGKYNKKNWCFHIDLFILINEILRIVHFNASNN